MFVQLGITFHVLPKLLSCQLHASLVELEMLCQATLGLEIAAIAEPADDKLFAQHVLQLSK